MAKDRKGEVEVKPLATVWHVPDAVWAKVEALIEEHDPPKKTGRKRSDPRKALDGIIYRGRAGCQWNQLPAEFGADSSVHRALQRWAGCGLFEKLWVVLLEECQELGGVDWQWQSADCRLGKARHGGTRSDPTPRTGPRTAVKSAC